MNKKHLKWICYFIAPWILLIPFSGGLNIGSYFKTIVLQPQKTGIVTFHYYDQSRNRPIVTEVWYPVDKEIPAQASTGFWLRCDEARGAPLSSKAEKYPLIVISHGSGADRYTVAWLAEVLTANGYIVAAMDHFGNTWNNKIPEYYARPWERPVDISFVLDRILESSQFKDRINTNKIGFAGYSLGGATGIWVAGAKGADHDPDYIKSHCAKDVGDIVPMNIIENTDFNQARGSFLDERFSAMVLMAPALGWFFDEKSLATIEIPIFIFAAENDEVAPFENNAKIFAQKISCTTLKVFKGKANHYVFLNRATVVGKRFLDSKYCTDPESIDRKKVHEEVAKNAVIFFNDKLR